MKVLINERLSENKYKTPEGYLICTNAILARTGKQTYTSDELFNDGDSTEIEVDRPFNEVINDKTIASFENKPITLEHPNEDVNVGNYKEYAVGYVRDVKACKTDDGYDVLVGNLVITDQDVINDIEEGKHTYLSCGYDCEIKDENGAYFQHLIRGNHIALCDNPRAGITRIVDAFKPYYAAVGKNHAEAVIYRILKVNRDGSGEVIINKYCKVKGKPEIYRSQDVHNLQLTFKKHEMDLFFKDKGKTKAFSNENDALSYIKTMLIIKFDSINDSEEENETMNIIDANYLKENYQGLKVVALYQQSNGIKNVIVFRPEDKTYIWGWGYNTDRGTWANGYYDFKTLEAAIKAMKRKYPDNKQIYDSCDELEVEEIRDCKSKDKAFVNKALDAIKAVKKYKARDRITDFTTIKAGNWIVERNGVSKSAIATNKQDVYGCGLCKVLKVIQCSSNLAKLEVQTYGISDNDSVLEFHDGEDLTLEQLARTYKKLIKPYEKKVITIKLDNNYELYRTNEFAFNLYSKAYSNEILKQW